MVKIARTFENDRLTGAEIVTYVSEENYELKAFVFGAEAGKSKPCVLFFHGGSWEGGSPGQFGEQSKYLAKRGLVSITFEYRLKEYHGAVVDECVADAKTAYRWAKQNAEKFGFDIHRMAVGGGSAGGHLALILALVDKYNNKKDDLSITIDPQALILFNPVADTTAERWQEKFGTYGDSLSPLHNIKKEPPPAIVFHGENDECVPLADIKKLKNKFEDFDARFDLHVFENKGHGFFNFNKDPEGCYKDTVALMGKFLQSIGWIKE